MALAHLRLRAPTSVSRVPVLLVGLLFTACCVTLVMVRPQALRELEHLVYDDMVRQLPPRQAESQIAILEIDERSLQQFGQWPWPRYHMARIMDALAAHGAKAVGLDVLYAEPDRTSLAQIQSLYEQDLDLQVPLHTLDPALLDNDALLARSLERLPVALGMWAGNMNGGLLQDCPPVDFNLTLRRSGNAPEAPPFPNARAVVCPVPVLAEAAEGVGFLNSTPDQDGKIRRIPLFLRAGHTAYPALALATILLGDTRRDVVANISPAGIEQITVQGTEIPTDGSGNVLLPFRPEVFDNFAKVSAAALLEGRAGERLAGKYVLIGTTVSGLEDMHSTPVSRVTPGIYLQALLADTVLNGGPYHMPASEPAMQTLLTAALGLLVTLLMAYVRVSIAAFLSLFLLAVTLASSYLLLLTQGVVIVPIAPALTLLLGLACLVILRSRMGERHFLERVRELVASQECALRGFASVAETRDPETGAHIIRTQHFVRVLADQLSLDPEYRRELTPDHIHLIERSAPLHDIGKVSVPDAVLLKPGKLTDEEFAIMKQHARTGYEVLRRARGACDSGDQLTFLNYAEEMALTHHEKWDGTGYPQGLSGKSIPLSGRLMALADVYDALRSQRVYKPAFSHEKARAIILEGNGKHFDPQVVAAFLAAEARFQEIWDTHPDGEEVALPADLRVIASPVQFKTAPQVSAFPSPLGRGSG